MNARSEEGLLHAIGIFPMKKHRFALASLVILLAGNELAHSGEAQVQKTVAPSASFHVDPLGNDANPGTSEQPFATLERARDAIRERRRASGGLPPGGVTVTLAGGAHPRVAAFELTAEDSGTAEAPIVYASARGEPAVLLGGEVLQPDWFLPVEDAVLLERLICPLARKKLRVCDLNAHGIRDFGQLKRRGFALPTPPPPLELFVDGLRMPLARYPNEGHLQMTKVVDKGPVQADADFQTRGGAFICNDPRLKHWTAAEEVWLNGVFSKDWAWSFNRIAKLDPETGTITLAYGEIYGVLKWNQDFFYAENLLEELDAPGEYYLDRQSGKLYLVPPERFENARITVSTLDGPMVRLENARHVTFRDLVFDTGREYAIKGNGEALRVESCEFVRLGLGAVRFKGTRNLIENCHIHHVGGTAIALEGGDWETLTPGGSEVRNCRIHDWGYWQRVYCPAVSLTGVDHAVRQNTFQRFPHTAIIVRGNDHLIEGNRFSEGPTDFKDMGAIYGNLGQEPAQRGTVIRGNLFEDIARHERQNAVYPDNGTMEWVIEQNIFLRCGNVGHRPMGAVFANGGAYLTIRDNLFVDCVAPFRLSFFLATWAQSWRPGYEAKWREIMGKHNFAAMPHGQRYPGLLRLLEEDRVHPDTNVYERNLIWNPTVPLATGEAYITDGGAADLVQAANNHIATDDPGFVDWQNMDFTLKQDAPVFERIPGLRVFDFARIGARAPHGQVETMEK